MFYHSKTQWGQGQFEVAIDLSITQNLRDIYKTFNQLKKGNGNIAMAQK